METDDTNSAIRPGATETDNGVDDNCNGSTDEGFDADLDTYAPFDGDCDNTNPAINPGAGEIPDGIDNNCDGITV